MGAARATRLWPAMLQRVADRAAHELKNPLNGAVLNVEVVRQRVQRSGTDASTLVPYAEAAASELTRAAVLVDALLALARPAHAPVDFVSVLDPLVTLYGAIAAQSGGEVHLEWAQDGALESEIDPDAVRAVLAAALDAAVADVCVRCRVERRGEHCAVSIRCAGRDIALPATIRRAMAHDGITLSDVPTGVEILFPRVMRGSTDGAE